MSFEFFSEEQKTRPIDVCAVENALVDMLVRASDADIEGLGMTKGIMQLVGADDQKAVLERLGSRTVEVELGGSAANALRGLAILGAQTSYSSVVGRDKYGEAFAKRLKELSIMNNLQLSSSPTGTCLVVVSPDGERTMNTHLGACREYSKTFVPTTDIRRSKIFFTTGYCWDTPNQIEAIEHAVQSAQKAGTKVAIDVADPFAVARSRAVFVRLMDAGSVDILFANAEEAQTLVGCKGLQAAKILADKVAVVAVKDGANGAYVAMNGNVSFVPSVPTNVVDTTGAGDMFAAGFLFGLVRGYSVEMCGRIGTLMASDNISHMGVRLSSDIATRIQALLA
jgi:sugar/nucleoside kinase (ribokinase family)